MGLGGGGGVVAFCALLSCVRIVEFSPRLGKKGKSSSELVEERDGSLSAAELI